MPIERAVFKDLSWTVFWTAPGQRPTSSSLIAEFTGAQTSPASPVDFDASNSNGPIVTYSWDFGDGGAISKTTGPTVSHSYAKPGTYLVILTVSDASGNAAQATRSMSVTVDALPVAIFDIELTDLTVAVDGTDSTDRDGQIASYDWDFGDGGTASGEVANHTYEFAGRYEITLIITDNQGATSMNTQTVEAAALPEAEFNYTSNGLVAKFDASSSYDFNPIVQYTWSWGYPGSTDTLSTTPFATHTFPADGIYDVTLTVEDSGGRSDFCDRDVQVAKIVVPQPPSVRFSYTVTNLRVNLNASKTTDVDSWITDWSWDFGDGTTGSGMVTSHTYAEGNIYRIKLTATDNLNAHASTTHSVTVSIPMTKPPKPTNNADIIIDTGNRFFMSKRDIEIGLMVALTESSLLMYANKNVKESLKYPHDAIGSDHDSLGLFQQRPSTGWGSVAQLMDPVYDAGKFFTALKSVTNRDNMDPWLAAQKVQVSAFADGSNYKRYWARAQDIYKKSKFGGSPPPSGGSGGGSDPSGKETLTFPYQDMNRHNVISGIVNGWPVYNDPDADWEEHRHRPSGGHGGVDHIFPRGTVVRANCAGKVIHRPWYGSGGNTLDLRLYKGGKWTGWYDQYMHLNDYIAKDGQMVKQGDPIAHSGSTADGSWYGVGPHLHLHRYEPGANGARVNAWHYFGGDGENDSRNKRPGLIVDALITGVPNLTYFRRLQWFGKQRGGAHSYAYPCDGFMSIPAWKGVQSALRGYGYSGSIDGSPGVETNKALQRLGHSLGGGSGSVDGSLSNADHKAIARALNTF